MELNKQDGGHRKFILCTNNENNICEEVTYQRLKTVITGKRADGSEYSAGIPANLKYFKTDFVDKDSEDLSDELLNHIKEMIELEHGIKVDNQQYVIILTDEDMDKFEQDIEKYADLKAVFVNQDIILTATQQKLLDSINSYIIQTITSILNLGRLASYGKRINRLRISGQLCGLSFDKTTSADSKR